LWVDYYNFQRCHTALDGLVPADRFFGASEEVLRTLKARVSENALDLARYGVPRAPFYLTGTAGGKSFSVHAEGERVILRRADGEREEVELTSPEEEAEKAPERSELPRPLCPTIAESRGDESWDDDTSRPGASALDDLVGPDSEQASDEGGER